VPETSARIEFLAEFRIGGTIRILKVLVSVQVIKVAPELVEACRCGKCSSRSPRWFLPNWRSHSRRLEYFRSVMSSFCKPAGEPGVPTVVIPCAPAIVR